MENMDCRWEVKIYITWMELLLKEMEEYDFTFEQKEEILSLYRIPMSADDYMVLIYTHDSPVDELNEWKKAFEMRKE